MKVQIRERVFETNSSSSHSLVMGTTTQIVDYAPTEEEIATGVIKFVLTGDPKVAGSPYTDLKTKVEYMLQVPEDYYETPDVDQDGFDDMRRELRNSRGDCDVTDAFLLWRPTADLLAAVKKHTGLTPQVWGSNQQGIMSFDTEEFFKILCGGKGKLRDFLFNPDHKIVIHYNDNGAAD